MHRSGFGEPKSGWIVCEQLDPGVRALLRYHPGNIAKNIGIFKWNISI